MTSIIKKSTDDDDGRSALQSTMKQDTQDILEPIHRTLVNLVRERANPDVTPEQGREMAEKACSDIRRAAEHPGLTPNLMVAFLKALMKKLRPEHLLSVFQQKVLRALTETSSPDRIVRRNMLSQLAFHFLYTHRNNASWHVTEGAFQRGVYVALMCFTLEYELTLEPQERLGNYSLWRHMPLDEFMSQAGVDMTRRCVCGMMAFSYGEEGVDLFGHLHNINRVFHAKWAKAAALRRASSSQGA